MPKPLLFIEFTPLLIGVKNSNQTESTLLSVSGQTQQMNNHIIQALTNFFDWAEFSFGNTSVNNTYEAKLQNENIFSFSSTATELYKFNLSCHLLHIDETVILNNHEELKNVLLENSDNLWELALFMTAEFTQTLGNDCEVTFICDDVACSTVQDTEPVSFSSTESSTSTEPSISQPNSTVTSTNGDQLQANFSNVTDETGGGGGGGNNVKERVS